MEALRRKKMRPAHPGEILREDVLPAIKMNKTEFAKRLGLSRATVSEILDEQRSLTSDTATRLAELVGSTPAFWLRMQQAVDLWDAQHQNAQYKPAQLRHAVERKAG